MVVPQVPHYDGDILSSPTVSEVPLRGEQDVTHQGKGGPKTEAGKKIVGQNSRRHGGFSRGSVPAIRHCPERPACGCLGEPETLCPLFSEMARRLTRQLTNLPHLRREHGVLVGEFVIATIRAQVIDRYLQRVGLVKTGREGLDSHPVMVKVRGHLSHLLARLSDQLALNPVSAKMMGLSDAIDVGEPSLEELRAKYAEEPPAADAEEQESHEEQQS